VAVHCLYTCLIIRVHFIIPNVPPEIEESDIAISLDGIPIPLEIPIPTAEIVEFVTVSVPPWIPVPELVIFEFRIDEEEKVFTPIVSDESEAVMSITESLISDPFT